MNRGLKTRVREKYNYRCALCGKYGTSTHHIVKRIDGGLNIELNLINLCEDCHKEVHNNPKKEKELFKRLKKELKMLFNTKDYYSPSELALILNVKEAFIKQKIEEGYLEYSIIDDSIKLLGKDIINWILCEKTAKERKKNKPIPLNKINNMLDTILEELFTCRDMYNFDHCSYSRGFTEGLSVGIKTIIDLKNKLNGKEE